MRIESITSADVPGGRRVSARLIGEGRYDGPDTLWYETDDAFAADFDPSPELFLLAAAPVAIRYGEPRVRIDVPVCPRFLDGFEQSLRVFHHWDANYRPVPIEASAATLPAWPRVPRRTAAYFSGGVDSLSMLRANRRAFPLDHPGAIVDGLFAFGLHSFDFDGQTPNPERLRAWREQFARMTPFAAATGLTLVPLRTNARTLHPDWHTFKYLGFGPATISMAHAFNRRISDVWIASNGYGVHQAKYSSHPLVDPCFSSGAVEVHHGEPWRLRQEKLDVVGTWDEALEILQVCLMEEPLPPGVVNCGRCEKCLRTMLGLLVVGRLGSAATFPRRDVSIADLRDYSPASDPQGVFSSALVAGLAAAGRTDLASILKRRVAHADRRERRRASLWRRLRRRMRRSRPS